MSFVAPKNRFRPVISSKEAKVFKKKAKVLKKMVRHHPRASHRHIKQFIDGLLKKFKEMKKLTSIEWTEKMAKKHDTFKIDAASMEDRIIKYVLVRGDHKPTIESSREQGI